MSDDTIDELAERRKKLTVPKHTDELEEFETVIKEAFGDVLMRLIVVMAVVSFIVYWTFEGLRALFS